jgi:hypothetical protein
MYQYKVTERDHHDHDVKLCQYDINVNDVIGKKKVLGVNDL